MKVFKHGGKVFPPLIPSDTDREHRSIYYVARGRNSTGGSRGWLLFCRMPGEPAVKTGWSLRLPSIVVALKRCGYRQVRECVRV